MESKYIIETEKMGQRLARLRKEAGLTQEELANKLNTSRSTLAEYERGRLRLHDELIVGIAKVLKTTADEILGLKIPKNYYDVKPSLRFLKRLNIIDQMPEASKKILLRMIDDVIYAWKNKKGA
jgi:transcriptional regulator with XRE-family HTH domain